VFAYLKPPIHENGFDTKPNTLTKLAKPKKQYQQGIIKSKYIYAMQTKPGGKG